jgi:hypothetical protein
VPGVGAGVFQGPALGGKYHPSPTLIKGEGEYNVMYEALAKLSIDHNCHAERSEAPRIFKRLRFFTSFRVTEKTVLQEARMELENY